MRLKEATNQFPTCRSLSKIGRSTLPVGGTQLANAMGQSKTGDVYRLDWMTLVPLGQNLFKLVSNSGTEVEQVHGAGAENEGLPRVLVFRLSYAGSRH